MPAIQMLKRDQLGIQRMFKPHSAAHQIQTVESGEVEGKASWQEGTKPFPRSICGLLDYLRRRCLIPMYVPKFSFV